MGKDKGQKTPGKAQKFDINIIMGVTPSISCGLAGQDFGSKPVSIDSYSLPKPSFLFPAEIVLIYVLKVQYLWSGNPISALALGKPFAHSQWPRITVGALPIIETSSYCSTLATAPILVILLLIPAS